MNSKVNNVKVRHDFVLLIDVMDGNPNGDPDAGNLPRTDPETMHGLITDVCIKRKVRNFVDLTRGHEARYKIYIQNQDLTLNEKHQRAYTACGMKSTGPKQRLEDVKVVRRWMCDNFYDIRTFGAVMSTRINCGQVRGPIQLTFARSVDRVMPMEFTITRQAITAGETTDAQEGESTTLRRNEMGRKAVLPYALYRCYGFFNPALAAETGFDCDDLELFWQSLLSAWDSDRSSMRGLMACRALYVFSHKAALGCAPAEGLFELIEISRRPGIAVARSFSDYEVSVAVDRLPSKVEMNDLRRPDTSISVAA